MFTEESFAKAFLNVSEVAQLFVSPPPAEPKGRAWQWLLLLPFVGLLFPGIYAHANPTLFGVPFFYWYQFAWVIASAIITGFVYAVTR